MKQQGVSHVSAYRAKREEGATMKKTGDGARAQGKKN